MKVKTLHKKYHFLSILSVFLLATLGLNIIHASGDALAANVRLSSITIKQGSRTVSLDQTFAAGTTAYKAYLNADETALSVSATASVSGAKITITGDNLHKDPTALTVVVSASGYTSTTYTFTYVYNQGGTVWTFPYTGEPQEFTIPFTGKYKLEVWGAQGGGSSTDTAISGGKGGYSMGYKDFNKGAKVYAMVGGAGGFTAGVTPGGYNGGGNSNADTTYYTASGGGATHFSTKSGQLFRLATTDRTAVLLVAGGGGGGGQSNNATSKGSGGAGGGTNGIAGSCTAGATYGGKGGTQSAGGTSNITAGSYGQGGAGYTSSGSRGGGGGGGYYGGGAGGGSGGGGGGGSGYVGSVGNYQGIAKTTIAGNASMPTQSGTGTMVGNSGDGYAKLTAVQVSHNNYLSSLSSNIGTWNYAFNADRTDYTVTIGTYDPTITFSGATANSEATVVGLGTVQVIEYGVTNNIAIAVTSASGHTRTYTIHVVRTPLPSGTHSNMLHKLAIVGEPEDDPISPLFNPVVTQYTTKLYSGRISYGVIAEAIDPEATVEIKGHDFMPEDGTITVTVTAPGLAPKDYKISYAKTTGLVQMGEFGYTGGYQTYTVPFDGMYQLQVWGAEGGSNTRAAGGKGGYSRGFKKLTAGTKLYIYVGGAGSGGPGTSLGGWNGGGNSTPDDTGYTSSGGGATDIRTVAGVWNNNASLKSRLIVAGGGGGAAQNGAGDNTGKGGAGGGTTGVAGTSTAGASVGGGGTQSAGGTSSVSVGYLGTGGNAATVTGSRGGGGGGGYYGGGSGLNTGAGGGGGSGYIGGVTSYAGITATTIAGNKSMPNYIGNDTMTGNSGDGHVRIDRFTASQNNYLRSLVVTNAKTGVAYTYTNQDFHPLSTDYYIDLPVDDTQIDIEALAYDSSATIAGAGYKIVPANRTAGERTVFDIVVTAQSGDQRTYHISVTRPASTEHTPVVIHITGLLAGVCSESSEYCKLDHEFDENIHDYYMTVPSGIRSLEFTVEKKHYFQSVTGDGVVRLAGGDNIITIEVVSEEGSEKSYYTFEIERDMSGNNYIDHIDFINPNIDIGFHYLHQEYSFKVNNNTTSLNWNVILDDDNFTNCNASSRCTITGNEDFKVGNNIVEIEVVAENGDIRTYTFNVYRVANANRLLSSLKVRNGSTYYTLTPEFQDIKTYYTLSVPNEVSSITIEATPQASTTVATGIGTYPVNVGVNRFPVITSAEDGSIETYTIVVTRARNSNTYLSTLSAAEGTLTPTPFNKDTSGYTITVAPQVKSLTLSYTTEAPTSTVTVNGNSNFKIGANTVNVTVTAEDGSTRKYTIIVTKQGSDNNNLATLSVNKGALDPGFDENITAYTVDVGENVKKITISGTKADPLSSVTGFGTYNLNSGANTLKVIVTSETGKKKTYVITVNRALNSDPSLKSLAVNQGTLDPAFSSTQTDYTVDVANSVTEIKITGAPTASATKVTGLGKKTLSTGANVFYIDTVAEDGTTTLRYTVTVNRAKNHNAKLSSLNVREGALTPAFNPNTSQYRVKVHNRIDDFSKVTVDYQTAKPTSVAVISKPETNPGQPAELVVGDNPPIIITVTAEDGTLNYYEIIVERQKPASGDFTLTDLGATGCESQIQFDPDVRYYSCSVPYGASDTLNTTISATLSDPDNRLEGIGTKPLSVGNNSFTIKIINTDNDEDYYQLVIYRRVSTDARLADLKVDGTSIPGFSPDTSNYTLTTRDTSLNLEAIKKFEHQAVDITGNENFVLGTNTVTITVTATDGYIVETKTYTLTVEKLKDNNAYLSSLSVEGYTLNFNKTTTTYNLTVENDVANIQVSATPEKPTSNVTGTGTYVLSKGANTITVTVTAEDGSTRDYTINITKLGSRNNNLSSLAVTGYTLQPAFASNVKSYTLPDVPYEVADLEVIAIPENEFATVTGDGIRSLARGRNVITISVVSENGELTTYNITVTRANPVTSKLRNISALNYDLDQAFDPDITNYTIVVDYEIDSLNLTIEKLDPNGSYMVEGNGGFSLDKTNTVKITSKSSDGQQTTVYTLNVIKQAYSNTFLSSLYTDQGQFENPAFSKTLMRYHIDVANDVEQITIFATAEQASSKVEGAGLKNLVVGQQEFKIKVTSSTNITRTYILEVNRASSNNTNVISVTSSLGPVVRNTDICFYLYVPAATTKVKDTDFIITLEDKTAHVSFHSSEITIPDTTDMIFDVISADNLHHQEYTIHVIRDLADDTRLQSLTVVNPQDQALDPIFNKDHRDYVLEVLDTATEVELAAVPIDNLTFIDTDLSQPFPLNADGSDTTITITVRAEDGTLGYYNVVVKKTLTTEKLLENIELTGILDKCPDCDVPTFNENFFHYNLAVPYEVKKVGFNVTKKHPNQSVTIFEDIRNTESLDLIVGTNRFVIRVENALHEVTKYTYTIERLPSTNNYLASLRMTSPAVTFDNFDRNKLEYSATVPYDVDRVTVEGIAEEPDSTTVTYHNLTLGVGPNDVMIRVVAATGQAREYIIHVTREPKVNNWLSVLTVTSGDIYPLSPRFDPAITSYSVSVPGLVSNIEVQARASDASAAITGTGPYNLKMGLNTIKVDVTVGSATRTYTLLVNREAGKNTYLESLRVNNGTLTETFVKEKSTYHVSVASNVKSLDLTVTPEDPGTVAFNISGNNVTPANHEHASRITVTGNENFTYGQNEVKIKVTSSDKSVSRVYRLIVDQAGETNNLLKNITLNGETIPGFNPGVMEYNFSVDYGVDLAEIAAEPDSVFSRVTGTGSYSFVVGDNQVVLTVISQDGSTQDYTLNIERRKNVFLRDLQISAGALSPSFDRNVTEYTLDIAETDTITLKGIADDPNATVDGNGSYTLGVGENVFGIRVTNGSEEKTYTMKVNYAGSQNAYLDYLTVAEGTLDPAFDKETTEYSVTVPDNTTSLTLDYAPEDPMSTVEISGNSGFNQKTHTVTLRVKSTGGATKDYVINVTREDPSFFSNRLTSLTVDPGMLSPNFDPDKSSYTVTVPTSVHEITVSAIRESVEATIDGVGTYTLSAGRNVITVTVTSKDNKSRTYTIIVYQKDGSDARLSKVKFSTGTLTPAFSKNIFNYTLKLEPTVNVLHITEIIPVTLGSTYTVDGLLLDKDKITITVTSPDGKQTKTYTFKISREQNSSALLKLLTVNAGTLTPDFEPEKYIYNVNVDSSVHSINITAVPESSSATVAGDGVKTLANGSNYYNVTVTSAQGSTRTYTIIVTRGANSNAKLASLVAKGITLDPATFDPDVTYYEAVVPNDVDSVIIEAAAQEVTTTVTGTGFKNLVPHDNNFMITSTAEDGTVIIYTISIHRWRALDPSLLSLDVAEATLAPAFSSETYDYSVDVPNEFESLTITAVPADEDMTVTISGNENLEVGITKPITVTVTSADGNSSVVYTINATRQINSNNYLSSLTVNHGTLTPDFDRSTLNYEVTVANNVSQIVIGAQAELTTSSVTGTGQHSLNLGENTFVVKVTSALGVPRDYRIKVTRLHSANTYLSSLTIDRGTMSPLPFACETTDYTVTAEEGQTSITLTGTAADSNATVIGNGEFTLVPGNNVHLITVTAPNGDTNTYTVTIVKTLSSNTNALSFTTTDGTLDQVFRNDLDEYTLAVPNDTNLVNFDVVLESPAATVTGHTNIAASTSKDITVTITAEDGTERFITIHIEKEIMMDSIALGTTDIYIFTGSTYQLNPVISPANSTDRDLVYIATSSVASVDENGLITGGEPGEATVRIGAKNNPAVYSEITVHVKGDRVVSRTYDVKDVEDGQRILIGVDEGTTVDEILDTLENDRNDIAVFDAEENQLTIELGDEEEIGRTGLILKLMNDTEVLDTVYVVVRGDLNGDGEINVFDQSLLRDHILEISPLSGIYIYAGDVIIDEEAEAEDYLNVFDISQLADYILEAILTLNPTR